MSRRHDVIPGGVPTFALALLWVGLLVVLPLAALVERPWAEDPLWILHDIVLNRRVMAALRLSFVTAFGSAVVATAIGLLLAWVLVRARPPGARLLETLVDLPFALPTAVAGITLTALYAANGWLGAPLAVLGIRVAYTPLGIMAAMIFVGLPFAVRTIQPVLRDMSLQQEEAAATLGASPSQIAWRVVLPAALPAVATGFGLTFARAVGEYGSVIFIAGNRPFESEIAPLLIVIRLQEFDYAGASSIGLIMLLVSALCLFGISVFRRRLPAARGALQ